MINKKKTPEKHGAVKMDEEKLRNRDDREVKWERMKEREKMLIN